MYFWRDKKLAHDLHKGFVSEKQQMLYLLFTTILMSVFLTATFGYNIWSTRPPLTLHDYAADIVYLAISFLIIFMSFKINNTGDGKDFLIRYICLGLPITIKSILIGLIFGMFGGALDIHLYISANPDLMPESATQEDYNSLFENIPSNMGIVLAMTFMMIYILWRYIVSFKIASGQEEYGK